jgi:hypothetical protein
MRSILHLIVTLLVLLAGVAPAGAQAVLFSVALRMKAAVGGGVPQEEARGRGSDLPARRSARAAP